MNPTGREKKRDWKRKGGHSNQLKMGPSYKVPTFYPFHQNTPHPNLKPDKRALPASMTGSDVPRKDGVARWWAQDRERQKRACVQGTFAPPRNKEDIHHFLDPLGGNYITVTDNANLRLVQFRAAMRLFSMSHTQVLLYFFQKNEHSERACDTNSVTR